MKRIKIFDTTLRDGEQSPGCSMNIQEKLAVALQLEKLGVDIIEAGFPVCSEGDAAAVSAIAKGIKNCSVAALARTVKRDIDIAAESLKGAVSPVLHVFIATSPIHMRDKLRKSQDEVLRIIQDAVAYAKSKVDYVQFSAEDALRSEPAFLVKAFKAAINAGASAVNVPDTVGIASPKEMEKYLLYIKDNLPELAGVTLSCHCHNDLGMATANSLAAVENGATQIEVTVMGIGERAGNTSLEETVMALCTKPDFYNAATGIDAAQIYPTCKMLSNVIGWKIPDNKPIIGSNAFKHESGIHQDGVLKNPKTYEIFAPETIGKPTDQVVLGKHSGRHAFSECLNSLGYKCTEKRMNELWKEFKSLTDKKANVTRLDIEALVSAGAGQTGKFALENFLIATKADGAFASVSLKNGGESRAAQADGNGALDSSFKAIDGIVGKEHKLLDYSLHAVTGGEDALGEAVVKLFKGGVTVTGRGVSTDIIEASILAYVDGVNKLSE